MRLSTYTEGNAKNPLQTVCESVLFKAFVDKEGGGKILFDDMLCRDTKDRANSRVLSVWANSVQAAERH